MCEETHVRKVIENGAGGLASRRHVREEGEGDADCDAVVRKAPTVRLFEERRCLAIEGETVESPRRSVKVGGRGGPRRRKQAGVDDRGKRFDACGRVIRVVSVRQRRQTDTYEEKCQEREKMEPEQGDGGLSFKGEWRRGVRNAETYQHLESRLQKAQKPRYRCPERGGGRC